MKGARRGSRRLVCNVGWWAIFTVVERWVVGRTQGLRMGRRRSLPTDIDEALGAVSLGGISPIIIASVCSDVYRFTPSNTGSTLLINERSHTHSLCRLLCTAEYISPSLRPSRLLPRYTEKMSKQASLFSFFSAKKPAPPKVSKPAAVKPAAVSAAPQSKKAAPPPAPPTSSVKIGDEIEIYWPDDSEYYACTVTTHLKNDKWKVEYGDGASETVDLSEQEWKVASKNALRRGPQGSGDEAEFDDDAMDDDSFNGDAESSSEEEEEDWMVDDDDEEADDDVFDETDEEVRERERERERVFVR